MLVVLQVALGIGRGPLKTVIIINTSKIANCTSVTLWVAFVKKRVVKKHVDN